jgi:hypothetical protein
MGYRVSITLEDVVIPGDRVEGALQALKGLVMESSHYSWVSSEHVAAAIEAGDLPEALACWRYRCELGTPMSASAQVAQVGRGLAPYADVLIQGFTGSKWGSDEILWMTLGPFLRPGVPGQSDPRVTARGEDGYEWRYLFRGGSLVQQEMSRVWDDI